jgi:hypothetical protein
VAQEVPVVHWVLQETPVVRAAAVEAAEVLPVRTSFRVHSPAAQAVAAKFVFLFFKDEAGE